jgi:hypothetical protein
MSDVTIQLQPDTERRLKEKAEQVGQTLEAYLERLAEHEARNGNGLSAATAEADEEEVAERPWRGVFVLPRPRDVLFSSELTMQPEQLPKRPSSLNMDWHRAVSDDE